MYPARRRKMASFCGPESASSSSSCDFSFALPAAFSLRSIQHGLHVLLGLARLIGLGPVGR